MLFVQKILNCGWEPNKIMQIRKKLSLNFDKIFKIFSLIADTKVDEKRLLIEIHRSSLFNVGLILRILFIIFFIPLIQNIWFIKFITNSLDTFTLNPWSGHLLAGGNEIAFPYGYVMYICYLPLTALGWLIDQSTDINYFSKIGFGLTSIFIDYGILISIALLARNYSSRLLLITYWCSPLVLYIFYWHGQLDALPVFLLVMGIVQIQRERPRLAGVLFGMALSAKFSMLTAIPFIIIYLYRNRRLRGKLVEVICSICLTLSLFKIPFINSNAYVSMVLQTPETEKLFAVFLQYGNDIKLFLLPTIYTLILYLVWRLEKITLDLFVISIGLGFFVLLLLLPPAPGWFLWIIPFLVFYQLRSKDEYLLTTLPFFFIYLIYNLLYSSGSDILIFDINTSKPIAQYLGFNNLKIKSILFTGLQSAGLLICIRMYIFGIIRNNYYQGYQKRLCIGINNKTANDSDYLVSLLKKIIGSESISHLKEIDYTKMQRKSILKSIRNSINPNTYNLSRLTKDLYTLHEGNPIWLHGVYRKKEKFERTRKIKSSDLIVVSGSHIFSLKRLRERLDLKIFFDKDQSLDKFIFEKDNLIKTKSQKSIYSEENMDFIKYINSQQEFADIVFRLAPINSSKLDSRNTNIELAREKLFVRMANGFFHEELVHSLIALCGMHIDVQQTPEMDNIIICIEGDASAEDIEQIANLLIPNLEDLIISKPVWENGYKGLMQIITLAHISDLLHRCTSSTHA